MSTRLIVEEPAMVGTRRLKNLKNQAMSSNAYCRDLTRLCLRLCIGVKLRAASSPRFAYHFGRTGPVVMTYLATDVLINSRIRLSSGKLVNLNTLWMLKTTHDSTL